MTKTTLTAETAAAILELTDDWKVVVGCLHDSGDFHSSFDARTMQRVREYGDGFALLHGLKTAETLDMLWDWSHVRDSSDVAIAAMANALRAIAKKAARPVCSTCGGAGQVRHKTGFVVFACPSC